jgi:hypothetical protein
MTKYGGVRVYRQRHSFLLSAPDGGEWSGSCPDHYPLGNRKMGELQSWSACFREKEISCTWQESNNSWLSKIVLLVGSGTIIVTSAWNG